MTESNLDILITRVIDGQASPSDWEALELLAAADASVWRDLALAQRDDQSLRGAVARATAPSAQVELPTSQTISFAQHQAGMTRRLRAVGAWGGWAAAAAIGLAFLSPAASNRQTEQPMAAGASSPFSSASDALRYYLDQGKKEGAVIGEMPDRVMLSTNAAADGRGYDVVFVRQIMERVRVNDLYHLSRDEAGNPTPVKVQVVLAKRGPA